MDQEISTIHEIETTSVAVTGDAAAAWRLGKKLRALRMETTLRFSTRRFTLHHKPRRQPRRITTTFYAYEKLQGTAFKDKR